MNKRTRYLIMVVCLFIALAFLAPVQYAQDEVFLDVLADALNAIADALNALNTSLERILNRLGDIENSLDDIEDILSEICGETPGTRWSDCS